MLWMERFAFSIFIIALVLISMLLVLLNSFGGVYSATISDWLAIVRYAFYIASSFWIIFRLVDFLGAGPLRRKIKHEKSMNRF